MPDYELTYGYNFDAANPLPPPMSSSSTSFAILFICLSISGLFLSSSIIHKILSKSLYEMHPAITVLSFWDCFFHLTTLSAFIPSLIHGRVPSSFSCNLTGVSLNFVCTSAFSCLTALAYDRLDFLRVLTKQTSSPSRHWYYLNRVCYPLLFVWALLPIITDFGFGIYVPKPNSLLCYAHGGRQILLHDLFVVGNVLYCFAVCFPTICYSLFKSQRIIAQLLSDRAHFSAKAAKAQQESLFFSVFLILLFLTSWAALGLHFVLLPLGISASWPPLFFNLTQLTINAGMTLNPILAISFNEPLQRLFFKRRKTGAIMSVVPGAHSAVSGKSQAHHGSVVSHVEIYHQVSFMNDGGVQVEMQSLNDRELAADERTRRIIIERLFDDSDLNPNSEYTEDEEKNLARAAAFMASVDGKLEPLRQRNEQIKLECCTPEDAPSILHATATVRASLQQVVAFLHHFGSAHNSNKANSNRRIRERKLLESSTDRSIVTYERYRPSGRGRRDRTTCLMSTCSKLESDGTIMYASFPTTHEGAPQTDEYVRASATYVWRIKATDPTTTTVELFSQLDFRFDDERLQLDNVSRPLTVGAVSGISRYFQYLRDELDDGDGVALATMLIDAAQAQHVRGAMSDKKRMARIAVDRVVEKSWALRRIREQHSWFAPLLKAALRSRSLPPARVVTSLAELTEADGKKIGGSLFAAAGVEEWLQSFPAMVEFEQQHAWFRSFMRTVEARKLSIKDLGAAARVYLGAVLSTTDMATDVIMITKYFSEGRSGFAWACTGMIAICMVVQLLVVWAQHHKKPAGMAKDMLLVVTFLKPASDAYKRASGDEGEDHHILPPKLELVVFKGIEMSCESIPSTVLQMLAIMEAGSAPGTTELLSVAVSILTTAFTSTAISVDSDCDPERRRLNPRFYGYMPDKGRNLVAALMMAASSCHIAVRSLGMALLLKMEFGWVYLVELGLYLLYKFARGDFLCWLRVPGDMHWILSLVERVLVKVIVDFTGCYQFRSPKEMGGRLFSLNLVVGHVGAFLAAHYYCTESGEGGAISDSLLQMVVGASSLAFVLLFWFFAIKIDSGYLWTFTSTMTAVQQVEESYRLSSDPAAKLGVLFLSDHLWAAIRADVKKYILANVDDWQKSKPPFWTTKLVSRVPDDMLSAAVLAKLKAAGEGKRLTENARVGSIVLESVFGDDGD